MRTFISLGTLKTYLIQVGDHEAYYYTSIPRIAGSDEDIIANTELIAPSLSLKPLAEANITVIGWTNFALWGREIYDDGMLEEYAKDQDERLHMFPKGEKAKIGKFRDLPVVTGEEPVYLVIKQTRTKKSELFGVSMQNDIFVTTQYKIAKEISLPEKEV